MKRCLTSLVFREMYIKTTMTYHYATIRMTIIPINQSINKILTAPNIGKNAQKLDYLSIACGNIQ